MRHALSAMPAYLRMSLASMVQYRGEMVLWALWGVAYPLVAMAAWRAAVAGSESGESIQGMTAADFSAYFLLSMIVGHICTAWDIHEMGYQVRSGAMSKRLLRPILPIWQNVSDNISYKTITLVLLVPLWILVGWIAQPNFETTGAHLAFGVMATLLAAAIHFIWGYALSLCAFWWTRMDAIGEAWWGMNLFLGGRLFPLEVMPGPLRLAADLAPFKWIIWFPARVLAGEMDTGEMASGIVYQSLWLIGGLLVFRLAWPFAVKRYTAVGN